MDDDAHLLALLASPKTLLVAYAGWAPTDMMAGGAWKAVQQHGVTVACKRDLRFIRWVRRLGVPLTDDGSRLLDETTPIAAQVAGAEQRRKRHEERLRAIRALGVCGTVLTPEQLDERLRDVLAMGETPKVVAGEGAA
jgi:hypothetical protein